MPPTLTDTTGADLIAAVAAQSDEELTAGLEEDISEMTARQGKVLVRLGEASRRGTFRHDGATSPETWLAERFGVSAATARAFVQVSEMVSTSPHLLGALCGGEVSFDKVRVLADVATPRSERALCEKAKECTVRQLADIVRAAAERQRASSPAGSHADHDRRYVRCNDEHRTISAQLPSESYVEAKARLDALLDEIPTEADTPLDQRRADAFMELVRSADAATTKRGSPFFVVAHVPLGALVHESGAESALAGELEGHGLIDGETVRRIACDATVAVAVDDDVGHTMYEGRASRFATSAQRREVKRRDRHCRFPGCTNVAFAQVHHIVEWKPGGGTDLPNLVLLCKHHHGLVHRLVWTMSGNANKELTFVGPSGRVMTTRPSTQWTRVSAGR